MRRVLLLCLFLLATLTPAWAQDGLDLPTELYVLRNDGALDRFGLGSSGVQRVSPADAFLLDFAVAPDGNLLAYRTPEGLFLRPLHDPTAASTLLLDSTIASFPEIRGKGATLAWSHDGDVLAFTALGNGRVRFRSGRTQELGVAGLQELLWSPRSTYLAIGAQENVWWIFRREGEVLRLTSAIPSASSIFWVQDALLAFTPSDGGLIAMNLADRNAQTPILDARQRYYLPYQWEDGRVWLFSGSPEAATLVEVTIVNGVSRTQTLGSSALDLNGLRWSPNGAFLVALRGGVLALVNPRTGEGFTLPTPLVSAYGWGVRYPQAVSGVQLPRDAGVLGYDFDGLAQVWRIPADGTPPKQLTEVSESVSAFALAPDGRRIAYVTGSQLVYQRLDTNERYVLTDQLGTPQDSAPVFSADSETLYFYEGAGAARGIFRVELASGVIYPFLSDDSETRYTHPRPASRVNALLVSSSSPDVPTFLVDASTGEKFAIAGNMARWLDGATVGFVTTPRTAQGFGLYGIYGLDVTQLDTPPRLLVSLETGAPLRDFLRLPDGSVRLLLQGDAPATVQVWQAAANNPTPRLLADAGYISDAHLSPDGAWVVGFSHVLGHVVAHNIAAQNTVMLRNPQRAFALRWR